MCIIWGFLSLQVHKVTDMPLSANHSQQIANNLPEILSGTVEGHTASVFR